MPRVSSPRRDSRRRRLFIEPLEPRCLLTADPASLDALVDPDVITAEPQASVLATSLDPNATKSLVSGYTPAQIRHAYGFDHVTFNGGKVVGDGSGQTIAIVDAYDAPTIAQDLKTFDAAFGLPDPPQFTKVSQTGGTNYPRVDAGWALETSLDVEWAHAIAPGAKILLVEAKSNSLSDLLTAVDYARKQPGVSVVSMSWGAREFRTETWYDGTFMTPTGHAGVTFVAASGDTGAPPIWPAISPNIVAVGGTSLSISTVGTAASESGWSGSGGGISMWEPKPAYQSQITLYRYARLGPDVSYDANPTTGFAVYDSTKYLGHVGWIRVGGTSAGAPQWAGLFAIVNQGRALAGQSPLASASQALYSLPSSDFRDVTSGSNFYQAGKGFDLVTGLGSPIANFVIADLVKYGQAKTIATSGSISGLATVADGATSPVQLAVLGDEGSVSAAAIDAALTLIAEAPTKPITGLAYSPTFTTFDRTDRPIELVAPIRVNPSHPSPSVARFQNPDSATDDTDSTDPAWDQKRSPWLEIPSGMSLR